MWSYVGRAVRRLLHVLKRRAAVHSPGAPTNNGGDRTGCIKQGKHKPKEKKYHAWQYAAHHRGHRSDSPPTTPHVSPQAHDATAQFNEKDEFLDAFEETEVVDGEIVTKQDRAEYAEYCRASSRLRKKLLCHMCVFDQHSLYNNKICPPTMLLHCSEMHKNAGVECYLANCRVRFATERERKLHMHFCHRLAPGWWKP